MSFSLGLVTGWVAGQVMAVLLTKDGEYNPTWRAAWLFGSSVVLMTGLKQAGFDGASALAVLVQCVVVVRCWGPEVSKPVSATFTEIWNHLAQPLLFGLVGAGVRVDQMEASELRTALAIIVVSLTWRLVVTFFAVSGAGLRWQERLFVAVGWLPKATVQAAIGAVAFKASTEPTDVANGHLIFTTSVVAILLTAPAGAAIISAIGPVLLAKDDEGTDDGVGAPLVIPEIVSRRGTASFRTSVTGSFRDPEKSVELRTVQVA
jgi:NhaP-type Na+/H+ or K+/H+ antiporter